MITSIQPDNQIIKPGITADFAAGEQCEENSESVQN